MPITKIKLPPPILIVEEEKESNNSEDAQAGFMVEERPYSDRIVEETPVDVE